MDDDAHDDLFNQDRMESIDVLQTMWIDRYAPTDRDTLGVHPKKVEDVNNWLNEAYHKKLAKHRRVLVLSGPSGAAKTATLKILAEEQEIEILEFRNGSNLSFGGTDQGSSFPFSFLCPTSRLQKQNKLKKSRETTDRESLVQEFTQFLLRAGMSPALTLMPDPSFRPNSLPSTSIPIINTPSGSTTKRLILVEDLPNISHYPTKLALRSALSQYLASPRVTCPLVLIVSEALGRPGMGEESEGGSRGESVDARNVLGIEILQAPGCQQILFVLFNSLGISIFFLIFF